MERRTLGTILNSSSAQTTTGKTGLSVPLLSVGCLPLGGIKSYYGENCDLDKAKNLIKTSIALGTYY
jgi:predicted aldo/keto reductase-like oxidoreductase